MKHQTHWLFETPSAQTIKHNTYQANDSELERDWELQVHESDTFALQEALPKRKVSKRVPRSSVRGRKKPSMTSNLCRSVARPEILDRFGFDQDQLQPTHRAQIAKIARCLVASQKTSFPIRSLRIVGHTDPAGSAAYNLQLGRRRAEQVKRHLYQAIESLQRGYARQIRLVIETQGEKKPISRDAAKNRRVEIFLPPTTPGWQKRIPPDRSVCGVPLSVQAEASLNAELYEFEQAAKPRVAAKLCLYQNASIKSHRNHFHCQADRWAKRIRAYAALGASRRVGPIQYDTGADIIRAIEAAHTTLNKPVEIIHIFSHSGSHGIFGATAGTAGLYYGALDALSRREGGRIITDIPTASLAQNVVFVLHGCNTAAGDDNFARALYQHLVASLDNPRVYGHYNGGCCGRDNSWRRYSKQSPNGKNLSSIQPFYQGKGCC